MPIPFVSRALTGWVSLVSIKKVIQTVVNFQTVEVVEEAQYPANFQPMSSYSISRLPEEYRGRQLWTVFVQDKTVYFKPNDIIQDPSNVRFRIINSRDWRKSGYTQYDVEADYSEEGSNDK